MELQLKHLAPYLPYGLKIHHEMIRKNLSMIGCELIDEQLRVRMTDGLYVFDVHKMKPILRPLSHLTKEIEYTEECLLDYIVEKLERHCVNYDDWVSSAIEDGIEIRILQAPYEVIEYCFENHYDVFGLIPRGLAIDINTIKI
jgi:hypothetical protein